jgi:hypothetical protein
VIVRTPEQVEAIRAYLAENADLLGVEKAKDHFAVPNETHSRTINLKARMANGHVVELRVEHVDMIPVAKQTHDDYKKVQQIDRAVKDEARLRMPEEETERFRLMDGIRNAHDEAAHRVGLDALLSEQGRDVLARDAAERGGREALPASSAISLIEEFGKRSGVIGGAIVAGALYASDADAGEIARGTAEAMVPGLSSAAALHDGRTAEAAMRGLEEIPFAGIVVSEAARPALRGAGIDLDPSIGQMLLAHEATMSPEQQRFMNIFDNLPAVIGDDMPPEVVSLAEARNMVLSCEDNLYRGRMTGPDAAQAAEKTLDAAQQRYTGLYDELAAHGGIEAVEEWIAQNPQSGNPGAEQTVAAPQVPPVMPARACAAPAFR